MSNDRTPEKAARAAGFSVHLFTACGAAVAVLALYAAIERNFPACFAWLGLALFIDGIDGTLARAAKVKVTAASIDGAILDLVIDFLTYVLVPVVALWRSDLMPTQASFWIGLVVTIASALYFADTRMKTEDFWFRGFPATWNILVLYLFVLRPPWVVSAAILLGGVGIDVFPRRVRPSAAGGEAARAHHCDDRRLVRLRRRGDRREAFAGGVGGRRPCRHGRLFPRPAALEAFALGVRRPKRRRTALPPGFKFCYRPAVAATRGSSPASWRSGYAEDCKSLHPGSIPGEASNPIFRGLLSARRGDRWRTALRPRRSGRGVSRW